MKKTYLLCLRQDEESKIPTIAEQLKKDGCTHLVLLEYGAPQPAMFSFQMQEQAVAHKIELEHCFTPQLTYALALAEGLRNPQVDHVLLAATYGQGHFEGKYLAVPAGKFALVRPS